MPGVTVDAVAVLLSIITFGVPVITCPEAPVILNNDAPDPVTFKLPVPKLNVLPAVALVEVNVVHCKVYVLRVILPPVQVSPPTVKLIPRFNSPVDTVRAAVVVYDVPPVLIILKELPLIAKDPGLDRVLLFISNVPLFPVKARVAPIVRLSCRVHVPPTPSNVKGKSNVLLLEVIVVDAIEPNVVALAPPV